MTKRRDIYAEVPPNLRDADDALYRYGRWAKDRARLYRCGSIERNYQAPPDDLDREPKPMLMHVDEAMACQRALSKVPDRERIVLAILYVPHRLPADLRLKRLRIPPLLSRERHILGLRMFDNSLRWVYCRPADRDTLRAHAMTQAAAPVEQASLVLA
jgi:hypothetical protein